MIVHTTTVIPTLGRKRQKENEFGNSLRYIVRILLKRYLGTIENNKNSSTIRLVVGLSLEPLTPSGIAPLW